MRWIEAALPIENGDVDTLCARLADLGVDGMVVEDEADFRDFLENNRKYWDYVDDELENRFKGLSRVKFYMPDNDSGRETLKNIKSALGTEPQIAYIEDSDWENNWREFYKPIEIGERLLVVPEWEQPELGGRTALRLDPGLIFGTGSHATTRMCLKQLEKLNLAGRRVLDLGCGSGILGIGAMVLGAECVAGCDVDPKAPDVAADNAALNDIDPARFVIYAGDVLTDAGMRARLGGGYDVVLANIVADVIIPLAALVKQFMAEGAQFITSGIIDGREAEVRATLEAAGLKIAEHAHEEEWHCFRCTL
ncbi:MAG: 50S ribosomal protein L11 methyltransferase [Oscillospiraceae bacterium]|nr:50S ribosomal protein L11 methyltransferase [Oscillospiraceae bacterium]